VIRRTARYVYFFNKASDLYLDLYNWLLDNDYKDAAETLVESFNRTAKAGVGYLDECPRPGDLVYIVDTNKYAYLVEISSDNRVAIVNEGRGPYPIAIEKVKRIR
jgi:hypothetical protein